MEQIMAYLIFGVGWPVLVIGTIVMLIKLSHFRATEKLFGHIIIVNFYIIGYVCTIFWLGEHWLIGVIPAFVAFVLLFLVTLHTIYRRVSHH